MKSLLLFTAMLAWVLSGPAFAALDPGTLIKLSTSVLKVEVIRVQGGYSLGSGVVVSADRVVTNCHVTRDARQIAVLQGGVRLPAQSQRVKSPQLVVLPLHSEPGVKLDYEMAMGVRFGEREWKQQVEGLIESRRSEIQAILKEYGVPVVDASYGAAKN